MAKIRIFILVFLFILIAPAFGQVNDPYYYLPQQEVKVNRFRQILNKISLTFTGGNGRTFYKHDLPGYGVFSQNDSLNTGLYVFALVDSSSSPFVGYQNWLNAPVSSSVTRNSMSDQDSQVLSDTANLGYRGNSGAIPFTFIISVDLFERFRIGGGAAFEVHHLPTMTPYTGKEVIGKYTPDVKTTTFKRVFGTIGGKVYRHMYWTYYADIQIGKIWMGGAYDKNLINQGLYFNIGFPIEYEFSEYLSSYIRPSYEYKSYKMDLPELGGTVRHRNPALYIHFGFRYTIPELPRCRIKANPPPGYDYPKKFTNKTCRYQKKHVHGDKAFRGQPFYKRQNPQVGENYPNLHKYRWWRLNHRKISGGY
jgi:hypothetical protein